MDASCNEIFGSVRTKNEWPNPELSGIHSLDWVICYMKQSYMCIIKNDNQIQISAFNKLIYRPPHMKCRQNIYTYIYIYFLSARHVPGSVLILLLTLADKLILKYAANTPELFDGLRVFECFCVCPLFFWHFRNFPSCYTLISFYSVPWQKQWTDPICFWTFRKSQT